MAESFIFIVQRDMQLRNYSQKTAFCFALDKKYRKREKMLIKTKG